MAATTRLLQGDDASRLHSFTDTPIAIKDSERHADEETSRLGVTRAVFLMLGVATLTPWNAVLTAVNFYAVEFPSELNPDLWFTMFFQVATLLVQLALVAYGTEIPFRARFLWGFGTYIMFLVALPVVDLLKHRSLAWIFTLLIMPFFGAGTGMVESSVYGFAGVNGQQAVMFAQIGESTSGLLVSVMQLVIQAAYSSNTSNRAAVQQGYIYFGVSAVFCLVCLSMFYVVPFLAKGGEARDKQIAWDRVRGAWEYNKRMACAVAVNYAISLSIFPGLVVTIPSSLNIPDWLPVVLIAVFNFGDCCGRALNALPAVALKHQRVVMMWVGSRVVFLPLFVILVRAVFVNDYVSIVATLLLGITNGFCSVNCWQRARECVPESAREVGGYIMTLAMAVGITAGVLLALATNKIADPAAI